MGGAITVHASLAFYGLLEISYKKESMSFIIDDCPEITCEKLNFVDIKVMFFAHILCIFVAI